MNITEFAEQIVFGTTLEDKLFSPGPLRDDLRSASGPNVDSLKAPHRPVGLQMQVETGAAIAPPSDDQLENESQRGQLLHFLANHELLATELMALVLLKFPNAPRAFRQGVLVTLQEEQEHTRMYLKRMEACGVEFGSYPLSGQFWRIVEPMQSPMDFVSRLSLTFEQANLDYSLHFSNVFQRIGDQDTSKLLRQIYEDEISHVQHGLEWFRKWKDPQQDDWDAYRASLVFPMSPQRGKGPGIDFNREGRKRAGLNDEFIDAMEVFRQSRGRAATLRWFDAGAEMELAGDQDERQMSLARQIGVDLEMVMIAISKPDDILMVRRLPTKSLLRQLQQAGFKLPEFTDFNDQQKLVDRKLHDVSPWAWTPRNHERVEPLREHVRHAPPSWKANWKDLYRKSWSTHQLARWIETTERDTFDWMPGPEVVGEIIDSPEALERVMLGPTDSPHRTWLFKQDLASSGRGQRRFERGVPVSNEDRKWLNHRLTNQQTCDVEPLPPFGIIEPELQRMLDLSFLFEWRPGEDEPGFLGWTRGIVTSGRRYIGSWLNEPFSNCSSEVKRFLLSNRCRRLRQVADWLLVHLTESLKEVGFSGRFGVDAIVYADHEQRLKIKPMVELNPRTTMGHIALGLSKRMKAGVASTFEIMPVENWRQRLAETKTLGDDKQFPNMITLADVDETTKLVPVCLYQTELRKNESTDLQIH
ncbi:MAG: DUF455 family protein [Planctomycetota bacterium]